MVQRTLVFTDIVDSTTIVQRLGDSRAAELWARHDRLAHELLSRHSGLEIDHTDGCFALFEDISEAVSFAVGYASIALLLRYLRTHTTFVFVGYRVALGLLLAGLLLAGVLKPL